jgi:nickel/cobalt exporter
MGRRSLRFLRATALALVCAAIPAAVLAHPLGNFTINHYAGITIAPDEIRLDVVIDMAEIPAFQERQKIDRDGDGDVTDTESAAAAGPACETLGSQLRVAVDGVAPELASTSASIAFPPGLGGLSTMRIECTFTAPLAPLTPARERSIVTFEDRSYPDRIGWREIVATGAGVAIDSGGLPTTSPSLRLTEYPADLLVEPIDMRSASIAVTAAEPLPAASTVPAANDPAAAGSLGVVPGGVAAELPTIFSVVDLTPLIIVLSLVTAFAFGAGHALTPGHGKTVMAAYLVGTRGTPLHAAGLGLSVAISHTIGILVLAALVVGAHGLLPPDVVARTAPVVSAVTIVAIGAWMLFREVRRRRSTERVVSLDHGHDHDHGGAHEHEHELAGEHSHGGVRHSHLAPAGTTIGWRGLFALGLAGGLIPSTSALFILLGSIVAGRPAFGFVLVVAFGLGMAAVMAGVGLAMVFARDRLDRLPSSSGVGRLAQHAPLVAAVVVLSFGAYLTVQALGGQPAF